MPVEFGPIASQFRERSMQASAKTSEHLLSDETFNAPSDCVRTSVGCLFLSAVTFVAFLVCVINVSECQSEWGRTADDFIVLPLSSPPNYSSAVCSDLNGGCWVAGEPVGLCHVDRLGNVTWGDTALWLTPMINGNPKLVPVDTGSVIVAMERHENEFGKIYLQQINLAQELMWGRDGIAIDSSSRWQYLLGIYAGPIANTYIVHWERQTGDVRDSDPRLQLVNRNGELLWGIGGVGLGFYGHSTITTTSDQCVVFAQNISPNPSILIRKLNRDGETLWDSRLSELWEGVRLRNVCDAESDREGGTIFVYEYERREIIDDSLRRFRGVNAVRASGNGDSLWTRHLYERDVESIGEDLNINPLINYAGIGRFFVAWADYSHAFQVVALDINGEFLWNNPIDIASQGFRSSDLVAVDSDSGVCYAWSAYEQNSNPPRQQWGQRIGLQGEHLWGERGRAIQTNIPLHQSATTDCNGGVITIRDFVYPNVQMMNCNGEIGAVLPVNVNDDGGSLRNPPPNSQPIIFPNPCNSKLRIIFDDRIKKDIFRYNIYNVLGCSITNGIITGVPYWAEDISRFPSGEYILQIQTLRTTTSKRFSLVK